MPPDRGNHGVPGGPAACLASPHAGALAAARRLALLNPARRAGPAAGQRLAAPGRGLATRHLRGRIERPHMTETAEPGAKCLRPAAGRAVRVVPTDRAVQLRYCVRAVRRPSWVAFRRRRELRRANEPDE